MVQTVDVRGRCHANEGLPDGPWAKADGRQLEAGGRSQEVYELLPKADGKLLKACGLQCQAYA